MSDTTIDELYQEVLLDHYRSPRNWGRCSSCGRSAHQDNPLCGDAITLALDVAADVISRVRFEGQGCAICLASASMMSEAVKGATVDRALGLSEAVRQMVHGNEPAGDLAEDLGDLMALSGVVRFPVRIKCALLPWNALLEALDRG